MADHADGSIIVDTQLDSEGFKAGSSELLEAIKSLSKEMRTLGETLKSTFSGSGVGKATQEADANITELQNRVKELEATLADMKNQQIAPMVDPKTEARIKELENTVSQLRTQLQETSAQPMMAEVDISEAETKITALETKVQELEQVIARLQSGEQSTGANVNFGGTTGSASALQRQIEAVNNSVNNLEPTFQRAMGGSESAMTSFQGRAAQLESKIATLRTKLTALGNTRMPTAEFVALSKEEERAGVKLENLLNKQERMKAMGVKENSAQWKNLVYDLQLASQKYDQLTAAKARMEASGTAYTMGADTQQYTVMLNTLSAAQEKLAQMRAESTATASAMSRVAGGARSVFAWIGRAAGTVGGKLLSGIKAAVSHMAKMVTHGKSMKKQFGGLISSAKRFGLSLLGARGVYALLRKAVNAYMEENQQLAAQLSACWSGIGNILGPIITRLIGLLSTAVAYLTQFLQLLGFVGKSTSKSIKSAGGSASKEANKLKRQLASFDDLNILSDNKSDGGGSGADNATAELPEVELPNWIGNTIAEIKAAFGRGDYAAIGEIIGNGINTAIQKVNDFIRWDNLGSKITAGVTGAAQGFNALVDTVDWGLIGDTLAQGFNTAINTLYLVITEFDWPGLASGLAQGLNGVASGIDWSKLGTTLSTGLGTALDTLTSFVTEFDWGAVGRGIADGINSIDVAGILGKLGTLINATLVDIPMLVIEFLANLNWADLGYNIIQGIKNMLKNIEWSQVVATLFKLLGASIVAPISLTIGIGQAVWELLKSGFEATKSYFNTYIEEAGGDVIQGLKNGIVDALKSVGTWIVENIWNPFIEGFKSAFGIHSPSTKMAEQGDFIIQGLLQGITNAWPTITSFFSNSLSSITSAFSTAWSNIKAGASTAWSGIKTTISNAWTGIKTEATNAYTAVKNGVSAAWSSIKSTNSTIWSGVKSTASSTWSSMKSTASSAWTSMKSTAASTWSGIKSSLSSTWSNIKSTASSTWSSMKSSASNTWTGIKSTASSTWSSIKSTLSSSWSSIKSTASSTWSGVKSTIQNQGWSGVGSNITSGIKTGISNGWSTLTNWVKEKAKSLLSAAKSALGIHSPSRLFRDQVGLNIGFGIGEGVERSESSVLDSVVSVADAIAEEFNAGEYEAANIIPTTEVNGALSSFANTITNSFTDLLNKLQAIAESVTFQVPVAANGMMPYKASAAAGEGGSDFNSVMEASNDELIAVLTQLFGVATETIVAAIKQYSGTTVNFDKDTLATAIIKEINRRTRMTGQSPLVG